MVSIDAPDDEQVVSMLGLADELTELLGTTVDVVARGVTFRRPRAPIWSTCEATTSG